MVYNADGGTTMFNINTGTPGSALETQWTINADATVQFTTSQNLAALNVEDGGFVEITTATPPNYKLLYLYSLNFAEHANGQAIGTLDLTNNGILVDFATDAAARAFETDLRGWLLDGRGGPGIGSGRWDGTGITSSTAEDRNMSDPEARSVGYAVNADLPLGSKSFFIGQEVDTSSILVLYTVTGDVDLDGDVDDDDVTVIGAFWQPGTSKPHWFQGDLDYNGAVDDDDVTLLGVFYGTSRETT